MGNQGKGKGAWGGSAKSSSSKATGVKRVEAQKTRGSKGFSNGSNPHTDGKGQSGQPSRKK